VGDSFCIMEVKVAKQVLSSLGFDDRGGTSFIKNSAIHITAIYENEDCRWIFSFVDYGDLQGPHRTIQRFYCVCCLDNAEDEVGFVGHYQVCVDYPLLSLNEIEAKVARDLIRSTVSELYPSLSVRT